MADRLGLGPTGEARACAHLRGLGFDILETGVRSRLGEIDIVARDGMTLVFVEVKARRGRGYGRPEEAVTRKKRQKLGRLASDYLARRGLGARPCRFDVVSVLYGQDGSASVELFRNAFELESW